MCDDGALAIKNAVKFSGVSRSLLYDAMRRGELAFVRIRSRRLIPKRELVRWLARDVVKADVA
jgi:excisionase family DNA binding protein